MTKPPKYVPAVTPPEDHHPMISPDKVPVKSREGQRQVQEVVEKTYVDLTMQQGMELKQRYASDAESRMLATAAENLSQSIDDLEKIRESSPPGSWGEARKKRMTDALADDTERRQRGLTEGVSQENAKIARKSLAPDEVEEPTFFERVFGRE